MKLIKNTSIAFAALAASSVAYAGQVEAPSVSVTAAPDSSCAWSVSYEYLHLQASSPEDNFDDPQSEGGHRFEASYQFDSDLAFRVRHFWYDGIQNDSDDNMDVKATDFELVSPLEFGSWSGEWSFGVRIADYFEGDDDDVDVDFSGYGLTVGGELTRGLSNNFGVYVKARTSLVFGDDDENDDHVTLAIHEIGAGVQYSFNGWAGCDGNIRVGYETQIWSGPVDNDSSDAGLDGLGVRVNFKF